MEITNLVRPAAAEVITITKLQPGDVYSRLQKESYSDKWFLIVGVVQTIHSNGTDAAFTAFEVNQQTHAVELKAYGTGADLSLFAATPEEALMVLQEARDRVYAELDDAHRKVDKARALANTMDSILGTAGSLTAPEQRSLAAFG
jgi:hypothetical protein